MEDFDPEVIRELQEHIIALNSVMGPLAASLGAVADSANTSNTAQKKANESVNEFARTSTLAAHGQTKREEAEARADREIDQSNRLLAASGSLAIQSLGKFSEALLDSTPGFGKYGKALSTSGEAVANFGESFGPIGEALGKMGKGIFKIGEIMLNQADAQNQFVKELNSMGAIAGITSDNITDMARDAGYASQDLEKLTKIITSAGASLNTLGSGTAEGVENLISIFSLSDSQEMEMRRYGRTLEEANEYQLYYLELQKRSGINLRNEAREGARETVKDRKAQTKLRERTLEYVRSLALLSEITGKNIDGVKRDQEIALTAYQNQIANVAMTLEIDALKAKSLAVTAQLDKDITQVKRDELEASRESLNDRIKEMTDHKTAMEDSIAKLAPTLGGEFTAILAEVMRTGSFATNNTSVAQLGINAAEMERRFANVDPNANEGQDLLDLQTWVEEQFMGGIARNVARLQPAIERMSSEGQALGESMGVGAENLHHYMTMYNTENDRATVKKDAKGNIIESTGKEYDAQKQLAALFQSLERNLRTDVDRLTDSINPLTTGFNAGTWAVGLLTVAATAASISLGKMAALGFLGGGIGGKAANAAKAFVGPIQSTASKFATKMAGPAGKVVKGNALLGVAAAIWGGWEHASEKREKAEKAFADKKITEDERIRRETVGKGEGYGTAVGGAGGVVAMGLAGAAIGSVVPVVGTAIGGIIGSALGLWMGMKGGELIGGEIAEGITLSMEDKKLDATNLEMAKKIDIYDKDHVGDSHIDYEKMGELVRSAEIDVSQAIGMMTAMIRDNDLNDDASEGTHTANNGKRISDLQYATDQLNLYSNIQTKTDLLGNEAMITRIRLRLVELNSMKAWDAAETEYTAKEKETIGEMTKKIFQEFKKSGLTLEQFDTVKEANEYATEATEAGPRTQKLKKEMDANWAEMIVEDTTTANDVSSGNTPKVDLVNEINDDSTAITEKRQIAQTTIESNNNDMMKKQLDFAEINNKLLKTLISKVDDSNNQLEKIGNYAAV